MGKVTFIPKEGTSYEYGWPESIIGDGLIELNLDSVRDDRDSAIYVDQFNDDYELWIAEDGEWTVEVRED